MFLHIFWNIRRKKNGMFFFSKYIAKIKNDLFFENFYKDFRNLSKTTQYFFLIFFGPLRRVYEISFRIFGNRNWKFFFFKIFRNFKKKKGCVELVIWYFSILIWAQKRGGRSFLVNFRLFGRYHPDSFIKNRMLLLVLSILAMKTWKHIKPSPLVLHVLCLVLHMLLLIHTMLKPFGKNI